MKATFFMPRSSGLTKFTPSVSKRSQAATRSGTEKQMWPNPRGSWLPLWYWLSSLSLPQLWVS